MSKVEWFSIEEIFKNSFKSGVYLGKDGKLIDIVYELSDDDFKQWAKDNYVWGEKSPLSFSEEVPSLITSLQKYDIVEKFFDMYGTTRGIPGIYVKNGEYNKFISRMHFVRENHFECYVNIPD